jgi:hypothetical protein
MAADMLSNVKFVQEKRLISRFFEEISQDTGKFVFTVKVREGGGGGVVGGGGIVNGRGQG